MKDISKMKLSELRKEFPGIKANSKKKFIEKLNIAIAKEDSDFKAAMKNGFPEEGNPGEEVKEFDIKLDTETLLRVERIKEHFPEYLAFEFGKETGCSCTIERYEWFMYVHYHWTPEVDAAIIRATYDAFGERVKKTSCVGCLIQRRDRLRTYYKKVIK